MRESRSEFEASQGLQTVAAPWQTVLLQRDEKRSARRVTRSQRGAVSPDVLPALAVASMLLAHRIASACPASIARAVETVRHWLA